LVIAGMSACSSTDSAQQVRAERFLCETGQRLDVLYGTAMAEVRISERIFRLDLKPGSLGERYTDEEATLIVDGDTAVFVSADGMDLRKCELLTSIGTSTSKQEEV
jgi:hypothetical protein